MVKYILSRDVSSLHTKDNQGYYPIHRAFNNISIAELLISRGVSINVKTPEGATPFHLALNGSTALRLFIEKGANVNEQYQGEPPIVTATKNGNIQVMYQLLAGKANIAATGESRWQAFHWACYKGTLACVNLLLRKSANVNARTPDSQTGIQLAKSKGHTEIVKLLDPAASQDMSLPANSGAVLYNAIQANNLSLVKSLVAKKADVNYSNGQNGYYALVKPDIRFLRCILDNGADPNSMYSNSLLYNAANSYGVEKVKLLLEKKADVHLGTNNMVSPIMVARGSDVIEALLEAKADIGDVDQNGRTALYNAITRSDSNSIECLLKAGARWDECKQGDMGPLHIASKINNANMIQYLVKKNMDVNVTTQQLMTPLHYACSANLQVVVQKLISLKANMSAKDKDGMTPIDIAKQNNSANVLKILDPSYEIPGQGGQKLYQAIQQGNFFTAKKYATSKENVNYSNGQNIYYAINGGNMRILEMLVENNADLNLCYSNSPLFNAVTWQKTDMIEYLIKNKADVNWATANGQSVVSAAKDKRTFQLLFDAGLSVDDVSLTGIIKSGNTGSLELVMEAKANIQDFYEADMNALHIASSTQHAVMVEFLVENGINVNSLSKFIKWTPLHFACSKNMHVVVQKLINLNADISVKDKDGYTPVDVAKLNNSVNAIQILDPSYEVPSQGGQKLYTAIQQGDLFTIKKYANKENVNWNNGQNIYYAISGGSTHILQLLIDCNADLNLCYSNSPLYNAVTSNRAAIVELLIKNKADVKWTSPNGQVSVISAVKNEKILKQFFDCGVSVNDVSLIEITKSGDVGSLKLMVEAKANVEDLYEGEKNALHIACSAPNMKMIDYLVKKHIDVNSPSRSIKWTPLHFACTGNNQAVVEKLVNLKADISAEDKNYPPLYNAVTWNRTEMVKLLIKSKADVKWTSSNGQTSVLSAATNNQIIKLLLNAGASIDDINIATLTGLIKAGDVNRLQLMLRAKANIDNLHEGEKNALHIACCANRVDMVEFLVKMQFDVNLATRKSKWTPIELAVSHGHDVVVSKLLELNADPQQRDKDGISAVDIAKTMNCATTLKILDPHAVVEIDKTYSQTELQQAVTNGNLSEYCALIPSVLDLDEIQNGSHLTNLIYQNQPDMIKRLLRHGIDPNKGNSQQNPLFIAIQQLKQRPALKIVEVLVAHKADVNATNNTTDVTPWHIAPNFDVIKLLIAAKQPLVKKNIQIAFLNSVIRGDTKSLKLLSQYGADVHEKQQDGESFIHIAADIGTFQVIDFLISESLDINEAVSEKKWTPLHYAHSKSNAYVVKKLLHCQADPNIRDADNHTPAEIKAVDYDKIDLLEGKEDAQQIESDNDLDLPDLDLELDLPDLEQFQPGSIDLQDSKENDQKHAELFGEQKEGVQDKIDERLGMCGVCRENFDEQEKIPKVLLCTHSFCELCIQNSLLSQNDEIICPQCSEKTDTKNYDLRTDTAQTDLIDVLPEHMTGKKKGPEMCVCERGLVSCFCKGCPDEPEMCTSCIKEHLSTPRYRRHKYEPGQKQPAATLECTKHQDRLRYFCVDDKELICRDCREFDGHVDHDVVLLENSVKQEKERVEYVTTRLENTINIVTERVDEVQQFSEILKKSSVKTQEDINIYFDKCVRVLNERRDKLLQELQTSRESGLQELRNTHLDLTSSISNLQNGLFASHMLMDSPKQDFIKHVNGVIKVSEKFLKDAEMNLKKETRGVLIGCEFNIYIFDEIKKSGKIIENDQ